MIKAGIRNVVVGAPDVNPRHSGKGIMQLRNAGVKVREAVLADECARLNEAFNKWIVSGRPFVIAKCGMSLDGRLRGLRRHRWITGPSARGDAQSFARAWTQCSLERNVRMDNSRLTVRGVRGAAALAHRVDAFGQPLRSAHLFSDRFASRTLAYKGKPLPPC
jgi:diaminohydroxyphosphoribosylaminopyrimidine deaminase/5-amino-6-(5-phosphoribosylamino)uracil reductase